MMKWWRKRQRAIDLSVLWPACLSEAPTFSEAKAVFAFHCFHDSAWTKDFTDEEIAKIVEELK